ncbi:MAG TPA: hypothetical protein DD435_02470 [Cyanobacteria bacterium UBA8530]|nr:hypothetical protein [Cyanobacteria bacterium UBA8530]
MPQHPSPPPADRLTRIHRIWWAFACSIFGGLWLTAFVLHGFFAVTQQEALIHDETRRLFDGLLQREWKNQKIDREDRKYLVEVWLPQRLRSSRLNGAQIVETEQGKNYFRAAEGGHPPFSPIFRHFGPDRFDFEVLVFYPRAPRHPRPFRGFEQDGPPPPPPPSFKQNDLLALVRVPLFPVLRPLFRLYGLFLLVGSVFLASFAYSLRVTKKGIAQELAVAHAKANFTAMVSHELKTPVAVLRMYSEMLRDGLVSEGKRKEFYRTMALEAVRLQRLIENLLDLGKVQSGSRSFRLRPEALFGIVEESIALARSTFSSDVSILFEPPAGLPEILADREVAVQAIANVIHNALKYGRDLPVEVQARLVSPFLAIEVLDRGPGIPRDLREKVFEPYVRIGSEETRTSQGTGLGLALVKAYMEGHGGSVAVGERPGGGGVFTLNFRIAQKGEKE